MKRQVTALVLVCGALLATRTAHADPNDSEGEQASKPEAGPAPNEVALDLGGSLSRVVHREETVGVRYENVEGDWALAIEPRAGFGLQDGATAQTTVASVGLDATADHRFPIGRVVTFVIGGGAGAEYIWQRAEMPGSVASLTNHALAVGPIAIGGVRFRILDNAWMQLGVRGGVELMNVDGSFGPVATLGLGWSGGVSF